MADTQAAIALNITVDRYPGNYSPKQYYGQIQNCPKQYYGQIPRQLLP